MHIGVVGPWQIILVLVVILLLFGAKKLPELSRSIGKSLGEFRKGQREGNLPDKHLEDQLDKNETDD